MVSPEFVKNVHLHKEKYPKVIWDTRCAPNHPSSRECSPDSYQKDPCNAPDPDKWVQIDCDMYNMITDIIDLYGQNHCQRKGFWIFKGQTYEIDSSLVPIIVFY